VPEPLLDTRFLERLERRCLLGRQSAAFGEAEFLADFAAFAVAHHPCEQQDEEHQDDAEPDGYPVKIHGNLLASTSLSILNSNVTCVQLPYHLGLVGPYRPAGDVFTRSRRCADLDCDSPYMLLVADVVPGRRVGMTAEQQALIGIEKLNVPRSDIPAVTHIDHSARIQTVHRALSRSFVRIRAAHRMPGCRQHELKRPRRADRLQPGGCVPPRSGCGRRCATGRPRR